MAEIQGTIKKPPRKKGDVSKLANFFFIQVSGSDDVYARYDMVQPRSDRDKILEGAVVSFELGPDAGQGPSAKQPIRVIAEAGSAQAQLGPAVNSAAAASPAGVISWPDVSVSYSEPYKKDADPNSKVEAVKTTVKLMINGRAAKNWDVRLKQNSGSGKKLTTDDNGQAEFSLGFAQDLPSVSFDVVVYHVGDPKKNKTYGFVWMRDTAATAAATTQKQNQTQAITFDRSFVSREIVSYVINYESDKDIKIETSLGLTWRRPGEGDAWKSTDQPFGTNLQGKVEVEVKIPESQSGSLVFSCGDVKSNADYVSNRWNKRAAASS